MKVPRLKPTTERQRSALDEAKQVAAWADGTTPEWVRVLGALWEAFDDAKLRDAFRAQLDAMLRSDPRAPAWVRDDPEKMISRRLDDLEVVIRQLRERSYFRAAAFAAEVATEVFPSESWVFSVAANCARQANDSQRGLQLDRRCAELLEAAGSPEAEGAWERYARAATMQQPLVDAETLVFALRKCGVPEATAAAIASGRRDQPLEDDVEPWLEVHRLVRMLPSDPEGAVEEGVILFDELAATPEALSETTEGHALTELLLGALTAAKDPRAIRIARTLLDAKLDAWGECPATWMERQNLGSVLAELGDVDAGRALMAEARARLADELGPDHPHVAMCDRNLARVGEPR